MLALFVLFVLPFHNSLGSILNVMLQQHRAFGLLGLGTKTS